MSTIHWATGESVSIFDAKRPLIEIIEAAEEAPADWIVLERWEDGAGPYFYAYRPRELQAFTVHFPDRGPVSAEKALDLHEYMESLLTAPGDRRTTGMDGPPQVWQPSMLRVVGLDAGRRPEVIGELFDWTGTIEPTMTHFEFPPVGAGLPDSTPPPTSIDLGEPRRSNGGARRSRGTRSIDDGTDAAPATVQAVLSAEAPSTIPLHAESIIDVRLELAEGATPLPHQLETPISPSEEIVAILSVDSRALKIGGPRLLRLTPPGPDQPTQSFFLVTGLRPGDTRVSIMFRQGGSDLGTISFTVTVATEVAAPEPISTSITAARREEADDDVLVLLIDEDRAGSRIFYSYLAHCAALRWHYKEFKSAFLQATRSGSGTAALRYVRTIYQQILDRVLINHEDLRLFQDELEAIGTDLCRQLFDPDFVRQIWDHRDKIQAVQVTTREPYIPWELLRLQHPDTREVDTKFLGEYGLVRSFSGRSGPRDLRAGHWRYLIGSYPHGSQPALGRELDYLTTILPGRGIAPQQIDASAATLLNTLKEPDFDVLHIACHGKTDLKNIEQSALLITDRRTPRGIEPVTISPTTVLGSARLEQREPIIFLNACETGQQAPSLTDWGGWPRAFWEAGAGAFIGTSWSVYEKPAATFARAFYDALLGGATLAEAAAAGRTAAKAVGDGSWLAYVIYGNPMARITTNGGSP